MSKKNFKLDKVDKNSLKDFVKKSKEEKRAFILLLLDNGLKNAQIADILGISLNTVTNIKKKYLEKGLDSALNDKPRLGQPKKYDDIKEAEIIALACTDPPQGRKQWTIRLIAEELNKKPGFETITRETVRLVLKKTKQNHGLKKCGV